MESPNITLLKIKLLLESMALSAVKWAAFCCTQNKQTRPPGCRQLWAMAGTGRTKQNLAPDGQLTPKREWGGRKALGSSCQVPYPRLTMGQVTQWGGLVRGRGEPSESLGSAPSGGLINSGEVILFRKIKLKERKNKREDKKAEELLCINNT